MTHRLDAGADTVHWGYFDAAEAPTNEVPEVSLESIRELPPELRRRIHRAAVVGRQILLVELVEEVRGFAPDAAPRPAARLSATG